RVLVADDNRLNRLVVREMLTDAGAEIDEAANGNGALNSIRQAAEEGRPYQFVLLDMAMPLVDGFEVARRLRNNHLPLTSILPMLSSDELKPQIIRLQQLGLSNYLVKPIARKELFATIRALIEEAQRDRPRVPDVRPKRQDAASRRILVAEDSPDN